MTALHCLLRRVRPPLRIALALSLLTLVGVPVAADETPGGSGDGPLMCSPPRGGATCDPGNGPAVLAGIGNGGTNLGAGNPINLVTGNKYQRETDLAALPGVLGLEIVRHYNSAYSREHSRSGVLGRGWKLSYETSLHIGPRKLQILQADGSRLVFERDPQQSDQCASNDPAHGKLQIGDGRSTPHYLWQWPDGQRMHFDAAGRLIRIDAASGEFLSLVWRADGALLQVTDPQGRSLHLHYPPPGSDAAFRGVTHIDSPLGRYSYLHGDRDAPENAPAVARDDAAASTTAQPRAALLSAVQWPPATGQGSGIERRYHYEDARHPSLLTGISVVGRGSDGAPMNERIRSWAYDEAGRAVRSVRGGPESRVAEVQLRYLRAASTSRDGFTEVRNSLDQTTRYRHRIIAGEYRLLEALGPGCADCSPANRRYRYDAAGRLQETTLLAAGATPDRAPQTVARLRNDFDAQGRVRSVEIIEHGTSAEPPGTLRQSFEYDDPHWPLRPTRIARPSVIDGKDHVLERRFNAYGQLTELIETGYSSQPTDLAQASTRATLAAPQPIARRLQLRYQQINGRSVLVAMDGPLPNGPLASPADSDLTLFHWDERGDFIRAVTRPGGVRTRLEPDPRSGLPVHIEDEDGHAVRLTYDVFGQVTVQRSSAPAGQPLVHSWLRNALGQETAFGSGSPTEGDFQAQVRRVFDANGKLLWSADALGIVEHYRRDDEGRLLEVSRSSASMKQLRQLPAAAAAPPAAPSSARAADRALQVRHQIDDFGRIVATLSPDSGETRRSFDAANRLVAMRDANGHVARYEYTVDGRIARQTVIDARDGKPVETRWQYQGRHLLRVDHPGQREHFEYDARGQRRARIVHLDTAQGEQRFAIRHEEDESGQLQASTLADGSRIRYLRNSQQQVIAIERDPLRTPWLRGLLRPQRIVSELQRDLVGLRSQRAGNGVVSLHQRSADGVLTRILHRLPDAAGTPALLRAAIADARAESGSGATDDAPGAFGIPPDSQALLDLRLLWDERGNLLHLHSFPAATLSSQAYDGHDRLIASLRRTDGDETDVQSWRYAYDRNGRRVLEQQNWPTPQELIDGTLQRDYQPGSHRRADFRYSAAGEVLNDGNRSYDWDAHGRLIAVHDKGQTLARYRYDHRGLRNGRDTTGQSEHFLYDDAHRLLAEVNTAGRITRQYLYLGETPLAILDSPQGIAAPSGKLATLLQDVATVLANWLGQPREQLYWVHTNHLGAPEAITDARAQVMWRASYAPFGNAHIAARPEPGLRFDLRLPGQIFDAETGLHYNRARYYDPARGQYLSPDPLGTPDGPDGYAYVAFNPLRYVDPDGLALFAFDGTGHHDRDARMQSNVVSFRDVYAAGSMRYVSGVGTRHVDPVYGDIQHPLFLGGNMADSIGNYTGPQRIDRMVAYFMDEADTAGNDEIMTVDIIGYSRGAAQARDFANRITAATQDGVYYYVRSDAKGQRAYFCQPVHLRFIGLFDTVLSVNNSGLNYQLSIPDAFSHVAHAIALNEFRGNTAPGRPPGSLGPFPLESIHKNMHDTESLTGRTRIEMGFIGSHGDIGGGYSGPEGELAEFALNWMIGEAGRADIRMEQRTVVLTKNPVIHDRSNAIGKGKPDNRTEDRSVHYQDGSSTTQRKMVLATGMSFPDTLQYIQFSEHATNDFPMTPPSDGPSAGNDAQDITGTVNAVEYLKWLNKNGYRLTLEIE